MASTINTGAELYSVNGIQMLAQLKSLFWHLLCILTLHHTMQHALMFLKALFTSLWDHCWSVWCFLKHPLNTVNLPQLFSDVAYKARDREDLIAGIDEFLDEVIVLPPGEWDPKIRIEPPKKVLSADKR